MPTRRITLEEQDDNNNGSPPSPPPVADDGDFSPNEHPWQYTDQARIHISDMVLMPQRDKLKEFTKIPQGMLLDMCLADTMVALMNKYQDPKFNAAEELIFFIDQRLRAHDGWITKLATVLAGDEQKNEDINPNIGPTI